MFDPVFVQQELGMYARRLCSGIYLSGRDPKEVFRNSCAPSVVRRKLRYTIDKARQRVSMTLGKVTRTAQFVGDQGSVILRNGADDIEFTPVAVTSRLPGADKQEWPMGDAPPANPPETNIDRRIVREALRLVFDSRANLTTAVVIVHKGVIVGERYAPGITKDTQLESWSMGKSLLATLFARLVLKGTYKLSDRVPIPEWQSSGDPRRKLRIRDILRMSSGLQCTFSFDPRYDSAKYGYPDHMIGYAEATDVDELARSKQLEPRPRKYKGRYRNCDPWIIGALIKAAVLRSGEDYLSFPQRELFDKIGIRRQVLETDRVGNLLFSGCDYGTARNWARLGLLYLQKGIWNGERLLPKGWTQFVSTRAPAWRKREYGAMFWLNRTKAFPVPPDSYFAQGGGGQITCIIPKHDLVVVRMGHARELTAIPPSPSSSNQDPPPYASLKRMLRKLMEAMPRK